MEKDNFTPKFAAYEIVKVISSKIKFAQVHGKTGIIIAISQTETAPIIFSYTVSFEDNSEFRKSRILDESDLISTGEIADKSVIYPSNESMSLRIKVNPQTNAGELINPEEDE